MSRTEDKAKGKIKSPKCPFCDEDWDEEHKKKENNNCFNKKACKKNEACGWGNIGIGPVLASRIQDASKRKKEKHPLAYLSRNLQAHHLICSEVLNDSEGIWACICHLTGYNINCYKNGLFLPSELAQACKAAVPLHRGGHGTGYGNADSKNYPDAVRKELQNILDEYSDIKLKICENKKKLNEFVEKINTASENIFKKIANFSWTITWDGFDYQKGNPIGCSNQTYITDKRGTRIKNKKRVKYSENDKKFQKELKNIKESRIKLQKSIEKNEDNREKLLKEYFEDSDINNTVLCNCKRTHSNIEKVKSNYNLKIGE